MEYFWETSYKFGEFLKKIFGENVYKRKYSLEGNGIFNLLYINNKIYEVKYTQARNHATPDNHRFTDDKEFILNTIKENLKTESFISGGKFMTFRVDKWIAKIEVIKKLKEPN